MLVTDPNQVSPRRKGAPTSRLRTPGSADLSLTLVTKDCGERHVLESTIARKFQTAYGAKLSHFLPYLVRLNVSGEVGAVAGIRPGSSGELFLEQYLDRPVEQAIAAKFHMPIDRTQVVEIGNLASNVPGLACALFASLACALSQSGFRWVAFTATPQVEAMLEKLGFASKAICQADPARLAGDSADWGNYYVSRPRVIVGDAHAAERCVIASPELSAALRNVQQPIAQLALALRRSIA